MYCLDDYSYELPPELIAQFPSERRESSRLMIVHRGSGLIRHQRFTDLETSLRAGDLLVLNDTRVVPARLLGNKQSGGRVELLVLYPATDSNPYRCLVKAKRPPKPGMTLVLTGGVRAMILDPVVAGQSRVEFLVEAPLLDVLEQTGSVPLPPYIRRNGRPGADRDTTWGEMADAQAYQTVYARKPGAVAAPTAGLHFSGSFIERLRAKGVHFATLTLHVGAGTFLPVREKDIRRHRLHEEFFDIPWETANAVRAAKEEGRRVVAVGTTTVRALEFAARQGGVQAGSGWCDLFIYPGYRFQVIDALLTNFHLPGSSLIMLVSAWTGRTLALEAYAGAVRERYRFYSYGDAMLIE
ncbi:MAG TPA: tRNA preQ1(34) S-adenosylmethionine ribosyltransferase-isomerase QueA [Syntrophobacteria bacterium]|nr:tRNA preQ1(34) S-adenosylmethionine ribosyltransferase-isomerase QueA [Syntrophobacteria bacterium]